MYVPKNVLKRKHTIQLRVVRKAHSTPQDRPKTHSCRNLAHTVSYMVVVVQHKCRKQSIEAHLQYTDTRCGPGEGEGGGGGVTIYLLIYIYMYIYTDTHTHTHMRAKTQAATENRQDGTAGKVVRLQKQQVEALR